MKQVYSSPRMRPARWVVLTAVLGAAVAGCRTETEPVPDTGADYYPVTVGAYRIYDVADTTWRNNVPTASRFQFREQVAAELSPDATGQPVYRVIRSRRATPADAWQVDSLLTVTVGSRFLTEQLGNRRTVALVFPVQQGHSWDSNAFNMLNTLDSAKLANRDYEVRNKFYGEPGVGFTISSGARTLSYDNTLSVTNDLSAPLGPSGIPGGLNINAVSTNIVRTTYAKGIGPVYRYRRSVQHCNTGGTCDRRNNVIGQSRREVLVESGQ